jgi:hypothetical protein
MARDFLHDLIEAAIAAAYQDPCEGARFEREYHKQHGGERHYVAKAPDPDSAASGSPRFNAATPGGTPGGHLLGSVPPSVRSGQRIRQRPRKAYHRQSLPLIGVQVCGVARGGARCADPLRQTKALSNSPNVIAAKQPLVCSQSDTHNRIGVLDDLGIHVLLRLGQVCEQL